MPLDKTIIDAAKLTLKNQGIDATVKFILGGNLDHGNELIAELILDKDTTTETATNLLEQLEKANVNTDYAYKIAQKREKTEGGEEKAGRKTKTEEILDLLRQGEQPQENKTINPTPQHAESKRSPKSPDPALANQEAKKTLPKKSYESSINLNTLPSDPKKFADEAFNRIANIPADGNEEEKRKGFDQRVDTGAALLLNNNFNLKQKTAFLKRLNTKENENYLQIVFNIYAKNSDDKTLTETLYSLNRSTLETILKFSSHLNSEQRARLFSVLSPDAKKTMANYVCDHNNVKKMQAYFQSADIESQILMMNTEKRWRWFTKPLWKSDKGKAIFQSLNASQQITLLDHNDLKPEAKQELFRSLVTSPKHMVHGFNLIAQSANEWVEMGKKPEQKAARDRFYSAVLNDNKIEHPIKRDILLNKNLSPEARGKLFMKMAVELQVEFIQKLEEHQKAFFAHMKAEDAAEIFYRLKTKDHENQELLSQLFAQQEEKHQANIIRNILALPKNLTEEQRKAQEAERKKLAGELLNSNKLSQSQREKIFNEFNNEEAAEAFATMPAGHTWLRESAFDRKLALLNSDEINIKKRTAMFLALGKNEKDESKKYIEKIELLADDRLNDVPAIIFFRSTINRGKDLEERTKLAVKLTSEILKKNPQRAQLLFNNIRGRELQANVLLELTDANQATKLFSGVKNPKRQAEILAQISKKAYQYPENSIERHQALERSLKMFQGLKSATQQASVLEELHETYKNLQDKISSIIKEKKDRDPNYNPDTDLEIQNLRKEANALEQHTFHLFTNLRDKNGLINHQQQAKILSKIQDPHFRQLLFIKLDHYQQAKVLNEGSLSTSQKLDLFTKLPLYAQMEIIRHLDATGSSRLARKLFASLDSPQKAIILDSLMGLDSTLHPNGMAPPQQQIGETNQNLAKKLFRNKNYAEQKSILTHLHRIEAHNPNNDYDLNTKRQEVNNERVTTFFDQMKQSNQEKLLSDPTISKPEAQKLQTTLLDRVKDNSELKDRLLTKTAVINNIKDENYKHELIKSLPPEKAAKLFNDTTLTGKFKLDGHADHFKKFIATDLNHAAKVLNHCDTSQQIKILNNLDPESKNARLNLITQLDPEKRSEVFNCTRLTGKLDDRASLFKELAHTRPEQAVDILNRSNIITGSGKALMKELDADTAKIILSHPDLKDKKKYLDAVHPLIKSELSKDQEHRDFRNKLTDLGVTNIGGFTTTNTRNSIPLRNSTTLRKEEQEKDIAIAEMQRPGYSPTAAPAA